MMKTNVFIKILLSFLVTFCLFFLIVNILFVFPSIDMESNCGNKTQYVSLLESGNLLTSQLKDPKDGLYRIEMFANNKGLKSMDVVKIDVLENNKMLASKTIDSFNVGDPGKIRVDIPVGKYNEIKMNVYSQKKTLEGESALIFRVDSDSDIVCLETFYKHGFGVKSDMVFLWIKNNWWLIILASFCLLLAI